MFPGLPDFSGIAKMGDTLADQFGQLIALLTKISDDTAAIRKSLEEKTDGRE